jgi:hypothetical protein
VKVLEFEINLLGKRPIKELAKFPAQLTLIWHLIHSPNCTRTDLEKIEKELKFANDFSEHESFVAELLNSKY